MKPSIRGIGAAAFAGFALFAFAAAAPPDISGRPPNGAYAYSITLGSRPIGAYTTVVSSTARAISSKQTFARTLLGPVTSTSTIVYDPRGLREISYTSQIQPQSGGLQDFNVGNAGNSLDISLNKAHNVNVPAQKNAPVLVVDDDFGPSDLFLPAILHASNAKAVSLFFLRTATGTLMRVVADDPAPRPAFVPASDASLTVEYQSEIVIHEVLWYDPATFVLHALEVPGTSVEIKLTSFTPAA